MTDCEVKVLAALVSNSPFDKEWAEYWCLQGLTWQEIVEVRHLGIWFAHRRKFDRLLGKLSDTEWEIVRQMIDVGKSDYEIGKALHAMRKSPEQTTTDSKPIPPAE